MIPPRYRTLDGDEIELPLAMGCWVLVPRALARFDPELAWTLDYEDAPDPAVADPRLDYSAGALLVPVERWNEHAALEPNLAPCCSAGPEAPARSPIRYETERIRAVAGVEDHDPRPLGAGVGGVVARAALVAIAALAMSYLVAVAAWLWSLRDGIGGPDVSAGLFLVGVAVLLAWLAGFAGAGWRRTPVVPTPRRGWPELGAALHLVDDPVGILRLGLAVQLAGFAVLAVLR